MSRDKKEFTGAKIIALPRAAERSIERPDLTREQVVTDQIVGILKDMLRSWRTPRASGHNL